MESKVLSVVQIINDSPIPKGEYIGTWSGYTVKFRIGERLFEAKTNKGIRGLNIGCNVIVSENGDITIQTR